MKKKDYLTLTFTLAASLLFNSSNLVVHAEELTSELVEPTQIEEQEYSYDTAYDNCIIEYAQYYNLNPVECIEFAREYTCDYTIDSGLAINGKTIGLDNPDKFAMFMVYNIYNNREEYGISKISDDVVNFNYDANSDIILRNNLTYSEFVGVVSDYVGIDPTLVLAISNYETGNQTSFQATTKNNFGGLRNKKGYVTYPSPEAGIISLVFNIDRLYSLYSIKDIKDLSGVYVNGNINKPSQQWINGVKSMKYDIETALDENFGVSYRA